MWRDKICIFLFAAILGLFTLTGLITKPKAFSQTENRFLETKPSFTMEAVLNGEYANAYEAFVTDQFVLRDQWIKIKTSIERLFLRQDTNGVFFGKDSYLIEKKDSGIFESKQAEKNIASLIGMGKEKKDRFSSRNIQFVIVPTASQVLEEKLPPFAPVYDQDNVINQIEQGIGGEYVINAGRVLKRYKDEYVYYRTDHHWTSLGAYYTYREWAERMGFKPFDKDAFHVEPADRDFYGTLSSKVNTASVPDTLYLWKKKGNPSYTLTYDMSDDIRHSLYDEEALLEWDKYKVYLGGNYGLIQIDTQADNGRRLLVIKDSFGNSFVPFACNHFESTYVADLRYFNIDLDSFMDMMGVTDVLFLYNTVNLCEDKNVWKIFK